MSRWPGSVKVLLFLVLTRVLLNIPALIGARWFPGYSWSPFAQNLARLVCGAPRHFPCIWARWDAENYLVIAANGYSLLENVAFSPVYPLLIRALALDLPSLMAWSGVFVSNLAFVFACVVLWRQVKLDFNESIAWRTIVSLSLFPTAFFFSAIYTESLFILFSILVFVLSSRKQYLLAGLLISLASLTRPNGFLLIVIPLAEILLSRPPRSWLRFLGTALISGVGLGIYGYYLWITQGSPLAFQLAERQEFGISIDWPWRVMWAALTGVISALRTGHGHLRYLPSFDLVCALLFIALTIFSFFFLKKSLVAYLSASVLAFLVVHTSNIQETFAGIPRYGLGFFPAFIVLAILLYRYPRLERVTWGISALGLFVLTVLFASGRYVG